MASEPRELRGEELVAQWRKMKDDEVPDSELNKWSIHLPPGYHKMLPDDLLAWVWEKKLDVVVEGQKRNDYLLVVHCTRIRANKMGYTSVLEYEKMKSKSPLANMRYDISQDYFEMNPNGRYEFSNINQSTEEHVETAKLLNTLARSLSLSIRAEADCESLKYAMDNTRPSTNVADYVVNVLDYLSWREGYAGGLPAPEGGWLDLLPYYKTQVLEDWQEGITAPRELEAGVEHLMRSHSVKHIGELNANLLWKCKNSSKWSYILTKLNDMIAKRAIERRRVPTSRCTIL